MGISMFALINMQLLFVYMNLKKFKQYFVEIMIKFLFVKFRLCSRINLSNSSDIHASELRLYNSVFYHLTFYFHNLMF